ncbi:MAG TPA: hypothetical protein VHB79_19600 [Polyangiaceae bacterium]|nr:hypothetical protein [Polyangiaceae bacterium]
MHLEIVDLSIAELVAALQHTVPHVESSGAARSILNTRDEAKKRALALANKGTHTGEVMDAETLEYDFGRALFCQVEEFRGRRTQHDDRHSAD